MADTKTVERLDRSKPPPGYTIKDRSWDDHDTDGEVLGSFIGRVSRWTWDNREENDDEDTEAKALTAAWEHHEARHDPPGMLLGAEQQAERRWKYGFVIVGTTDFANRPLKRRRGEARTAAWAWYWRRVELMTRMLAAVTSVYGATWSDEEYLWPSVLTWPDKQVDDVLALLRGEVALALR